MFLFPWLQCKQEVPIRICYCPFVQPDRIYFILSIIIRINKSAAGEFQYKVYFNMCDDEDAVR